MAKATVPGSRIFMVGSRLANKVVRCLVDSKLTVLPELIHFRVYHEVDRAGIGRLDCAGLFEFITDLGSPNTNVF